MPHYGELLALASRQSVAPSTVTPGASPYVYTAPADGRLVISGGTVTTIEVGRNASFATVGLLAGVVPVKTGDQVRITYLVAPTVKLLS